MFSDHYPKKVIKEYWKGPYKTFKHVERNWKQGSHDKNSHEYKRCKVYAKNKKMYGCFYDVASHAIFWAYIQGASKITVVGNDGYTLYSKKDLQDKKASQHCYGEGETDGYSYAYCRRKDWFKYRSLKLLYKYGKKQYGFGFEIITPTIYKELYNDSVFNIPYDPLWQEWEEPTKDEYDFLYKGCLKKRKFSNSKYG